MTRGAHRAQRSPLLAVLRWSSACFVVIGLGIGAWLGCFYVHSESAGGHLLSQARQRIEAANRGGAPVTTSSASCTSPSGAVGELVIPSISLVAPVVEGDGDAQLSDAVGHVPTSVWPGGTGTAVFVAHDVTWFHDLDHLVAGTEVEYVSECHSYTYQVTAGAVVTAGTSVANTPGALALVTCWPLDALWFTGQRYLLQGVESGGATNVPAVAVPATTAPPPLSVPQDLASVDTLASNPTPLGALTESGDPGPTYEESSAPLADAAAAQDLFFAAQRAAEARNGTDWAVLAPSVPMSAAGPLLGATVTGFPTPLTTSVAVSGTEMTGGNLVVKETLSGPTPGTWSITAQESITSGKLTIAGFSVLAAS